MQQQRHVSYGQTQFENVQVPVNSINSSVSNYEHKLYKIKLRVVTTSKSMHVYGQMKKEKLLNILADKLIYINPVKHTQSDASISHTNANIFIKDRLQAIIHRGTYSEKVIKTLQVRGMPVHTIVKAMKLGLLRLRCDEFNYFKDFELSPNAFVFGSDYSEHFKDDLIVNLNAVGLNDTECWHIIMMGVASQQACTLYRMALSGIDIPGILNWETSINPASPHMLQFLRVIGMEEDIIQKVYETGIDDESVDMLTDLGYKKDDNQEMTHECSLIILGPCNLKDPDTYKSKTTTITCVTERKPKKSRNKRMCATSNKSLTTDEICSFKPFTCFCHETPVEDVSPIEMTTQRNDYLRQNVMVPLAWALGRTLRDGPSDPKHYLAHQLLRWKYNTHPGTRKTMDEAHNIVAVATLRMDAKLMKAYEEKKVMEESVLSCATSLKHHMLHRIRCGLWIYTTMWESKYERCDFPQACSSCQINLSEIINSMSSSTSL